MRENPRRGYDQLIVKALISATGVYPVGTLVILDTFEMGLVVEANRDPTRLHQPKVRLLTDAMGLRIPDSPIVDLTEVDPATGRPLRSIIKTTDPEKYGIRVGDYFI